MQLYSLHKIQMQTRKNFHVGLVDADLVEQYIQKVAEKILTSEHLMLWTSI